MLVVSNTSPISNLAIIDRLDLLRHRYKTVTIPGAVSLELQALTHPAGIARINSALTQGWLLIDSDTLERSELQLPLDAGEAAAIRLAHSRKADVLLLDERKARAAARQLGLKVAGILGELLYAKSVGLIPSVQPEMIRLRLEAKFFIDPDIERFILTQCGE